MVIASESYSLRVSRSGFADWLAKEAALEDLQGDGWLERWLIPRHARALEDHLAAGRYLLWVRIHDPDDEKRVCTILLKHADFPIQVHDLAL